jgi:uncharacterized protein (DUF305 family)
MSATFRAGLLLLLCACTGAQARTPYSEADLQFLQHMIVHHGQALELCKLVEGRSSRAEFLRFVRHVNDAQDAEIHQMQQLLNLAAERGARIRHEHMHGDPPMAGMLSKAQMEAIGAARHSAFEKLWLEGMILHHQGGVEMAMAQQEAQFRNGNQPWSVDTLVDDMLTVQRAEITQMRVWLREWQ